MWGRARPTSSKTRTPEPQPTVAAALKALTGVVEHGLFPALADEALVATDDGVRSLGPGDAF